MKKYSGKVRDVYEISDDQLVIVTTDRISAFDVVLPKLVPGKGKILNAITLFWFDYTKDILQNHVISANPDDMPAFFRGKDFEGRVMLVKKLNIIPFECVVRGYMFGSIWQEYTKKREFCGQRIDGDYILAQKLSEPLFTPSTKAKSGHDVYSPIPYMVDAIGFELMDTLRTFSFKLYDFAYKYAFERGIIIADAKFEFGLDCENNIILADEIFTPDSSRFWDLASYAPGSSMGVHKSYDKQFLRDWLTNNTEGGKMQFDKVPDEILLKTAQIYAKCERIILNDTAI